MNVQANTITVINGHLTAKDKAAIKALLAAGLTIGKVGRKTYSIAENNGLYAVSYKIRDKGLVPVPGSAYRLSTYSATFKLK
ncbi:hypothetical protein DIU31_031960 [Mucilaginibacter rubeus]|uniref:Uncharacterized protein n=1 Tax=Mucilaginibacter rubeus TaxID=2027860 RepID=A0AAE6MM34_9SPHI|nr:MULTISPECIES: hypothetical protein [Mucilaginibacter]QEM07897.1 hypothetical protein DIU31_031960 [Mucilaginibacter rubeus]QEM20349.1 hypothetical protein DIU38_031565 [Mucilaginibacter gossypii]QTE42931.1 hypothetical protein J3L19_29090 [Mucilaginibacter rubeus]QTE49532.1 hypothetical protein J3L21_29050 [Mucilaginibacter rubeus]QTE54628.1 hypothetical protein J3L23_20675 [Mucilaginibacter rubeus]